MAQGRTQGKQSDFAAEMAFGRAPIASADRGVAPHAAKTVQALDHWLLRTNKVIPRPPPPLLLRSWGCGGEALLQSPSCSYWYGTDALSQT